MQEDQILQQAISAARAGRELTARDLFLDIVKANPRSETAWMWLTGLLDDRNDCIQACERVLEINPANEHARRYLTRLLGEKQKEQAAEKLRLHEQLRRAQELIRAGSHQEALILLRELTREAGVSAEAWDLLAQIAPEMDEKILALEKFLELNPEQAQAREELQRLRHFQGHPLDLAAMYEEQGNLDRAITAYGLASMDPRLKDQWDSIYWKIVQLENLRQENIAHISPAVSVARLAAGPPILYLLLLMVQVGLNPFAEPAPLLWLGILPVFMGGFMVALASIRSRHRLWYILFKDLGAGGSPSARAWMSLAGWALILLPHAALGLAALNRLIDSTPQFVP